MCGWFAVLLSGILTGVSGQDFVPKREFRAAWVATMACIDWPSRKGLTPAEQQREFVRILDSLVACRMNAVIVQVRPKADAFYRSDTEPWSEYLTGRRDGDPGYDPLAFMVREAHRRGLELHAWLNPFRITSGEAVSALSPRSVARRHPDWTVRYGGRWYLDPGLPQVRDYLLSVVAEVVRRYPVDAIHMDDYFYPYPSGGQVFADEKTFRKYGAGRFDDVAQWRRDNVNRLIKGLADTIRATREGVRFGVSPFGIYRNASPDDSTGSRTKGLSNYDDLYADVALWMRQGWVDYVLPQLYWENGHPSADFGELLRWWSRNGGRTQLYIGHGAFHIGEKQASPCWNTAGEVCAQLRMQRENPVSCGSAFYSARHLTGNAGGLADSLRLRYYRYPALTPVGPCPAQGLPPKAREVRSEQCEQGGVRVSWRGGRDRSEAYLSFDVPAAVRYYVVYRFRADQAVNINDASHIVGRVWADEGEQYSFFDKDASASHDWVYAVTSVGVTGVENEDFSLAVPFRG